MLNGPDIRKLIKSQRFTNVLGEDYATAWDALKNVIAHVLGKKRAPSQIVKEIVKAMLDSFNAINVSMTLKLHFLHYHLDEFLQQLPSESDEQGERFHQITLPMEKRYKGKRPDAMLAEVCWWSNKITSFEKKNAHLDDEGQPSAKKSRLEASTSAPMETDDED